MGTVPCGATQESFSTGSIDRDPTSGYAVIHHASAVLLSTALQRLTTDVSGGCCASLALLCVEGVSNDMGATYVLFLVTPCGKRAGGWVAL
jgi:hypothetical protein